MALNLDSISVWCAAEEGVKPRMEVWAWRRVRPNARVKNPNKLDLSVLIWTREKVLNTEGTEGTLRLRSGQAPGERGR
jgi:hypothetical protein